VGQESEDIDAGIAIAEPARIDRDRVLNGLINTVKHMSRRLVGRVPGSGGLENVQHVVLREPVYRALRRCTGDPLDGCCRSFR